MGVGEIREAKPFRQRFRRGHCRRYWERGALGNLTPQLGDGAVAPAQGSVPRNCNQSASASAAPLVAYTVRGRMLLVACFDIVWHSVATERKPLFWVGSSKDHLKKFPADVQDVMGYALDVAQQGKKHADAKPLG